MQEPLFVCAGIAALVAGTAAFADRRRARRRNIDQVGWVPWPLVLILSIMLAAVCVALALRS